LVSALRKACNAHDMTQTEPLLRPWGVEKLVTDKAYDSRALIEMIHDRRAQAVISPRANSQNPRATIKPDGCYLAFVMKASILICLA